MNFRARLKLKRRSLIDDFVLIAYGHVGVVIFIKIKIGHLPHSQKVEALYKKQEISVKNEIEKKISVWKWPRNGLEIAVFWAKITIFAPIFKNSYLNKYEYLLPKIYQKV